MNSVQGQLMIGMSPKEILASYYRVKKTAESESCYRIIARVNPLFFQDIAEKSGKRLSDLITLFKDSRVVKLFRAIGFQVKNLHKILRRGYKALKDLKIALMDYAESTELTAWTKRQINSERISEIDKWLKKHPKTKRITGLVVGAILAYIWFNMTFTGNPLFDFDMGDMLSAMAGKFSLIDIFSGAKGASLLILFMTGLTGLSFPWPGPNSVKFVVAVLGTIAYKTGKRMRSSNDNNIDNYVWRETMPKPFNKTAMTALDLTNLARQVLGVRK